MDSHKSGVDAALGLVLVGILKMLCSPQKLLHIDFTGDVWLIFKGFWQLLTVFSVGRSKVGGIEGSEIEISFSVYGFSFATVTKEKS